MSGAVRGIFDPAHQAAVRQTMKACPAHALDYDLPDTLQEKLTRLDDAFAAMPDGSETDETSS